MRHRHGHRQPLVWFAALVALGLTALMAACGGGEPAAPPTLAAAALPATATETAQAAALPALDTAAPASNPRAMPADPSMRTRRGLYLRRADADLAEARLRGDVVWVQVDCCSGDNSELAMQLAFGVQAAKNLDDEAPFFVAGDDLRTAAQVADRLHTMGLKTVYLVSP
ncbi:MAG: hypothetical protein Q8L92_11825 [Rubrivivax sp.]|nr:hypothetical protein [Rubrivivax sp.]